MHTITVKSSPRGSLLEEIRGGGFLSLAHTGPGKDVLDILATLDTIPTPPNLPSGSNILHVMAIPELKERIMRDVACKRHVFNRNEIPNLRLLGLRYGVTIQEIRRYNDIEDPSIPVLGRPFLHIPPRNVKEESTSDRKARYRAVQTL